MAEIFIDGEERDETPAEEADHLASFSVAPVALGFTEQQLDEFFEAPARV